MCSWVNLEGSLEFKIKMPITVSPTRKKNTKLFCVWCAVDLRSGGVSIGNLLQGQAVKELQIKSL